LVVVVVVPPPIFPPPIFPPPIFPPPVFPPVFPLFLVPLLLPPRPLLLPTDISVSVSSPSSHSLLSVSKKAGGKVRGEFKSRLVADTHSAVFRVCLQPFL